MAEKLTVDDLHSDYVDGPTAKATNLTFAAADAFVLRADDKNQVDYGQPGRKSVRLVSTQTFTHHVSMYVNSSLIFNGSITDPRSHRLQLRCSSHASGLCYVARNLGSRVGKLAQRWRDRHRRGC